MTPPSGRLVELNELSSDSARMMPPPRRYRITVSGPITEVGNHVDKIGM